MTGWLAELYQRSPVLTVAAAGQLALLFVFLLLAQTDQRTILGLNPWIKPMKFAASIAIYLATLAWLLGDLRAPNAVLRTIEWGSAIAMAIEIFCIAMQSARGVRSHFNVSTAFDGGVFSLMGLAIVFSSLLAALTLILFFFRPAPLPPAYLWGVRLGLILFLAGSAEAGSMLARSAHTVGGTDGGPGLPFLDWSVVAGDLRVAHAVGLHSLQVLPLTGWLVARTDLGERGQMLAIFAAAAAYAALFAAVYRQALAGRPLPL